MKSGAYLHQLSQALSRREKHGSYTPQSPSVRLLYRTKPNISIALAQGEKKSQGEGRTAMAEPGRFDEFHVARYKEALAPSSADGG